MRTSEPRSSRRELDLLAVDGLIGLNDSRSVGCPAAVLPVRGAASGPWALLILLCCVAVLAYFTRRARP
ncbi:hypothetical protein [Streptomyces sp. NPDC002587]